MRVPATWTHYLFHGPETIAVAVDLETLRCQVLEGEAMGKRFVHPNAAAAAILETYHGILTGLPTPECIEFPGDLWEKR